MKRRLVLLSTVGAVASLAAFMQPRTAQAASGLWIDNATSGGLWGTAANWNNGIIANGVGSIATFNTPGVVNTVNLDSSYTLGGINFNSTSTSLTWNISNNSVATNILTLSTTTGVPTINVLTNGAIDTISATIAGTQGFTKSGAGALTLSGSNSYSGVTTLNSTTSSTGADLYLNNNAALGTSSLFIDPGAAFNSRVLLGAGIVIPNNITINTARAAAGANSSLMTNGTVAGAGFSGSITINAKSASGGHISGPADSTLADFLTLSGPIYLSTTYNSSSGTLTNTAGNGVLIRSGNVILGGGGSYFRLEMRSGDLRLGANNGIATNAYVDLGGNANGNPLAFGIVDLDGFNQTLVGIQNLINTTTVATVTNSSTTTPSTLTLTPISAVNNANEANLVFTGSGSGTGSNATFTDTGTAGAYLNLVINGDAAGIQTLNTPASSYHGTTTLTSGILSVNTLANGGSSSSIGAASNAATNLIFNGGTLQYTGGSTSTDHDFTLNAGTTSTINVSTAASILTTTSGGGLGGTGSGNLIKAGPGTLLFSAANTYTGTTTVSAGTLLVDGSTAAGSNVSIASGGVLGGTGTVAGTVIPAVGGIVAPGDPSNNSGVGTLSVGTLNLSTGAIVNFELTSGSGNDEINAAKLNIVSGGKIDLYQPGTTTTFSTNGTYPLFNVTGTITGSLNSLSIATPAAGKAYSLLNSGGVVNLTIASATTIEWNDAAGTNVWSTGGNWIGGTPPNGVGQTALFGVNLVGSNGTVTLNSTETVSGVVFNNSGVSYSLGGAGPLVVNNGVAAAAIDILNGSHSINVPITLSGATALNTTNSSDVLTITGNMTGANPVTVTGPGTVTLTGNNTFTTTSVTNSTLNIGTGATGTLGSGAITLAGNAILNFDTNSNYNLGQAVTGLGAINQMGSATLTLGAISGVTTVAVSNGSLVATSIGQSGGINVTGSGSLTASGAVSGAGKLTVNTSGAVLLSAANSYTGGTEVDSGTLTLGAAGAFPNASALAVNGGTLDLHGNSIAVNNILDTGGSGVITNSVAATTATVAFTGAFANYNIYAALNDGPSGGKVALTSYIENTTSSPDGAGDQYTLILNASSTYSGGTTVTKQSIEANANSALGTGPVTLALNDGSTNNTRLYVAGGITLSNNITIAQPNPYAGYGAIEYLTGSSGSTTLTGSITQQADAFSGGTFVGPTTAGTALNINGPVYTTGTSTTISVRGGIVGFGGGGSYPNLNNYSTILVNATNGIYSGTTYNSTQGATTLDLTGYNQTLAGLVVGAGTALITNSSTTPVVLTVNTATPSNFSGGTISGNLSLAKAGSSTLTLTGAHTYTGNTTISGGTLLLAPVTPPSLVAAYSFDNTTTTPVNSAPTTIVNNGTGGSAMNGAVTGTGVTIVSGGPTINGNGGHGNSLAFDGTGNGSVIISSPITDLSGTGTWTASSWVNTSTSGSTLFTKLGSTTTWTTGNSTFYLSDGGSPAGGGTEPSAVRYAGGWITGTQPITDGTWHMVTYVNSGGTKTIYVDGVAVGMATGADEGQFNNADVGTLVQLGLASTAEADGQVPLNGNIDDLNFFSGALTATQVANLYTTNNAGALSSYVLPIATAVNITASGAALDLDGDAQTIASLTGVAGSKVILGGGSLIVGDSTTTTFAGTITDAGGASSLTGGTLVKQGTGTLILSSANTYSGTTTINAGLLVGGAGLSSLGTGSLTTINGGELILRGTSASAVNALLASGFNGGAWNGTTGINSTTAAADSTHLHALGMLQPSVATTFEGQALGTGDVAVKYTYYGDANLDGKVDGSDYSRIDNGYANHLTGWYNGDFNYDGVVNGSDYTLIDNAYNTQGAVISSEVAATAAQIAGGTGASSVPEPTTLGLLGIGVIGLLGRNRRLRRSI